VYGRTYETPSGCIESCSLRDLENFFIGISYGEV
jgi:hypothetical protein